MSTCGPGRMQLPIILLVTHPLCSMHIILPTQIRNNIFECPAQMIQFFEEIPTASIFGTFLRNTHCQRGHHFYHILKAPSSTIQSCDFCRGLVEQRCEEFFWSETGGTLGSRFGANFGSDGLFFFFFRFVSGATTETS